MTHRGWSAARVAGVLALATVAGLVYLRDPLWIGSVTSGLRPWEEDPPGTRFRWTAGRASLFVAADAPGIVLPLRSVFAGPVDVEVRADDRWLATVHLSDPATWVRPVLPLSGHAARRYHRRIDLRVSRVVPPFMLGVMVGEVRVVPTAPAGSARLESALESAAAVRLASGWDSRPRRPTRSP